MVDGSNQPMAGIEVSLHTPGHELTLDPAISDAQGRFAFSGLTAGEYTLSAEGSGFGTVSYGETPDPFRVSSIRVGGESGDKSVVFRIVPRGSIEGTVRDEFGDPMARISVQAERPVWLAGRTTMAHLGQKFTDDRGRFRFGNLTPGSYVMCVAGGQNTAAPLPGPVDYATRVESRAYGRTCNRAFPLSPGQRAQVDLTPLAAPTVTVRGHVQSLPPQTGFNVQLTPDDDSHNATQGAFVDATQGTFTMRGVMPGHYRLRAQSFSNTTQKALAVEFPLDVGGSDIDGLEVALDSQATVEVVFHGVKADQTNDVSVTLVSAGHNGGVFGSAHAKDGVFQFPGVWPGSYRVNVQVPEESCVESVKLADREIRGAWFDVAAGAAPHVDVAVTQRCGSVALRAVRDGAPVPRAKVVLLRSGAPKDSGDVSEGYSNDEGECTFSGVTPGKYLLWAWAVEGPGAITGPSTLAAVEQQATPVEVKAGDPVKVDVPLLASEGSGQ